MRRFLLRVAAPVAAAFTALTNAPAIAGDALRGTGDLGIVIERADGRACIIDTTEREVVRCVDGLGDLSHASAVFSPDQRYAYIFGRDGGLTKLDLLKQSIEKRLVQAGNSIGGAISDDGELVAVSNYEPGGVRVFNASTLEPVADISASYGIDNQQSKTIGLVDAPGRRFMFSLYDAGEIWSVQFSKAGSFELTKFGRAGELPYDALITDDGRHYIAGLFGEDGLAHIDLWQEQPAIRRILDGYGRGEQPLPVYKMPHLEGWARAGDVFFLPAVGRHELLVVSASNLKEIGRIPVHGQPVFAIARPDGRHVWVNFAHPLNDTIQVIDVMTMKVIHEFKPGPAVLHMEFTPRGHEVWVSVRDANRVDVYDTGTFEKLGSLNLNKPSGIFFAARANRIGL